MGEKEMGDGIGLDGIGVDGIGQIREQDEGMSWKLYLATYLYAIRYRIGKLAL